ncbi:MAG TPA: tripartite tricarboxylate transporter TctB family protein [Thiolinea sp.]|nr:tripartite tricarboxylate transporter TctB family protein [Thiolinea sp.]
MQMDSPSRQTAEFWFTGLLLLFSLLLWSQLGSQVTYSGGQPFFKQPGLWVVIGLSALTLGCSMHFWQLWRSHAASQGALGPELLVWLRSLEFLGWFLLYVWLVPTLGYLPATVLFMPILTLRLGYVEPRLLLASVLAALTIVLVFKTFLQAKIPGGALYEYLPTGLRNFFSIYF